MMKNRVALRQKSGKTTLKGGFVEDMVMYKERGTQSETSCILDSEIYHLYNWLYKKCFLCLKSKKITVILYLLMYCLSTLGLSTMWCVMVSSVTSYVLPMQTDLSQDTSPPKHLECSRLCVSLRFTRMVSVYSPVTFS